VVAFATFATGLGYLVGNEIQANTQFDHAHRVLDLTRHRIELVLGVLAVVRRDLRVINGQVDQAATALAHDTAQLHQVEAALAGAQEDVSTQGSTIVALRSCLAGVEQGLNALSVSDQGTALDALDAASTSCHRVLAPDG
jgi:hypothetical protein